MSVPAVTYRYRADLPHPVDAAYAWLTDYQDSDPQLTRAVVRERRVVRRGADEIEMQGVIEVLDRRMEGPATVRLHPEECRWVATLGGGRMVYDYRLTPTPAGCRLDVEYRIHARRWSRRLVLRLARRRAEREIATMWAGFLDAMRRDLPVAA